MNRRDFLKTIGAALAFVGSAGVTDMLPVNETTISGDEMVLGPGGAVKGDIICDGETLCVYTGHKWVYLTPVIVD